MFQFWRRQPLENRILSASAVVLLILMGWILKNPQTISCDCAAGLEWGRLIWHGATTYVDVCELDPPLWGYLNIFPSAIADLLRTPQIWTFSVLTWLTCVLSKIAVWLVFTTARNSRTTQHYAATVILIASLFDLCTLNIQGDLMFGQREHYVVLVLTPYLILRFLRWEKNTDINPFGAALVGIAAASGVCLKPQYVFIPAALELFWILQKRSISALLRPEIISATIFGAMYAAHFVLFENIRRHYLERWVPLLIKGYRYSSFGPVEMFWITFWVKGYPQLLVLATCLALTLKKRSPLLLPSVVFAWAGYASYLVQAKTWSYQAVPMIFGLYLTFALAALAIAERFASRGQVRVPAALATTGGVAIMLFGLLFCEYLHWEAPFIPSRDTSLRDLIVSKTSAGDPVLILSTTPADAYPLLLQLDRQQASRYDYEYGVDIFGYLRQSGDIPISPQWLDTQEKRFVSELAEDIHTRRPRLILVREDPQVRRNANYSVADYVRSKPELNSALNSGYRCTGKVGYMQIYEPKP